MKYLMILALFVNVWFFPTHKNETKPFVAVVQIQHMDSTEHQVKCLADAIYYEAKDEPYEGRLGVATVVMNRVHNRDFPNSICGVVYQKSTRGCQFSWVCTPHRITEPRLYEDAKKLAYLVLVNHLRLPEVKHALFFHNTSVNPSWDNNMTPVFKVGEQIFYAANTTD